jgi:hypothetical protein
LEDGKIIYYNRYVDDIILIYDQSKINPQIINTEFNTQHKELPFTINEELHNQINYLDLNLINKQGHIEMEIYRKPTATDTTINENSCHPNEHKLAAYRSWIHRLRTLPLREVNRQHELNTILNIAANIQQIDKPT